MNQAGLIAQSGNRCGHDPPNPCLSPPVPIRKGPGAPPRIRSLVTATFQSPDGRGLGASAIFSWKRPNFTYLRAQVNIVQHPASSGGRKIKNQGETCGSLERVQADSIFLSIKPELSRRDKNLYYFSRILWNQQKYRVFYRNSLKKIDVVSGRICGVSPPRHPARFPAGAYSPSVQR